MIISAAEQFLEKSANVFDWIYGGCKAVVTSPYFMIALFSLQMVAGGATGAVMLMLSRMGLNSAAPLLVEIGVALLLGTAVHLISQTLQKYIVAPLFSKIGQLLNDYCWQPVKNWVTENIIQPVSSFITSFSANFTPAKPNDTALSNEGTMADLSTHQATYLPSNPTDTNGPQASLAANGQTPGNSPTSGLQKARR